MPALGVNLSIEFPTGNEKRLLGSGLTDYYLYGIVQKSVTERIKFRIDGQFFNLFNHPNFGLPVLGYAGIPGNRSTQTGFGALTYTTAPPTGLLGVGLGGDSSPRMIAFQARLEF